MHELPPDPSWHHDAIIYQLHVKAFRDASRDGYGDFRGLLEKLDYIASIRRRCATTATTSRISPACTRATARSTT
jgi:hypothetical protein